MHKIVTALAAMVSLLTVNMLPSHAQNGHASHGDSVPSVSKENGIPGDDAASLKKQGQDDDPLIIEAGETVDSVKVTNRPVIIAGRVRGNVEAMNSHVTLRPGAVIEGNMTVHGALVVENPHFVHLAVSSGTIAPAALSAVPIHRGEKKDNWFGGQVCLWLLGLASGLIALWAAPNPRCALRKR